MVSRDNFVCSIGYKGASLVVDNSLRKKFGHLSAYKLLEKGMYRAAICAAVYERDESALKHICKKYAEAAQLQINDPALLCRIFGVGDPFSEIQKIVRV